MPNQIRARFKTFIVKWFMVTRNSRGVDKTLGFRIIKPRDGKLLIVNWPAFENNYTHTWKIEDVYR